MSPRSARRVEEEVTLPSQEPRRYWRSRPDPFAGVWDSEVVPLLRGVPKLMAITLLRKLRDRIARHELAPGAKLLENELSREFGVSRTKVRDVFGALEQRELFAGPNLTHGVRHRPAQCRP